MKHLDPLGSFKRDFKRITKRKWDVRKLEYMIALLRSDEPLPLNARPHKLTGDWVGFWECHVGPDWILIYDVSETTVLLVRTGTHVDLFE